MRNEEKKEGTLRVQIYELLTKAGPSIFNIEE